MIQHGMGGDAAKAVIPGVYSRLWTHSLSNPVRLSYALVHYNRNFPLVAVNGLEFYCIKSTP